MHWNASDLQQQQQQPFYGPLSGKNPVEPVPEETLTTHHPDHHPIFISFFHLPRSIASSLFKLHAWQSFCTTSFHVLFGHGKSECFLTLDKMSITSSVEYDSRIGCFLGDVTLREHTHVATHCLVFMIAGITYTLQTNSCILLHQ